MMIIGNASPSATISYAIPASSGGGTVVDVVAVVVDVSGFEVDGAGRVVEVEDVVTGSVAEGSAAVEHPANTTKTKK
jgi:hypothetical protein